jgi:exodeoxyribonuclease V alpha subunit
MTMPAELDVLRAENVFSPLDVRFAEAMLRLAGENDPRTALALAVASRQVGAGHVCVDLARLAAAPEMLAGEDGTLAVRVPAADAWVRTLRASKLVGEEGAATPLVLDTAGRLYLRRYFEHERHLAEAILACVRQAPGAIDRGVLDDGIARLFGAARDEAQSAAARTAVERRFTVISGGPGTGKTSTVVKILALLVEQAFARGQTAPRVVLLAPTGKAAARMSESVATARASLACREEVRAAIAGDASTIHRALGAQGGSRGFRYDAETPLLADVVVVDEASMVDLALMDRLFTAIPPHARVILLGDKDQLASVEAGAVLGDICGAGLPAGAPGAEIGACVAQLTHSWRYGEDSGIGALARAINLGDADAAVGLLRDPERPDVRWVESEATRALWPELRAAVVDGYGPCFTGPGDARLRALGRFRVVCAHRRGPHGLEGLNRAIEALLAERGWALRERDHYAGLPVLVTQNDYGVKLFNGDLGVVTPAPDDATRLHAVFPDAHGGTRAVALARLPAHERVYATSVHKCQGSEMDEVAVVLPPAPSPLTTRELLYTAVTRARMRVTLYATEAVVRHAIATRVERTSGLRDRLWY